jgi:hypothetical protein
MHIRYRHWRALWEHATIRTVAEPIGENAVLENLEVLRTNGSLRLRSRKDRDLVYNEARRRHWQGARKAGRRELRMTPPR